MLSVPEADVSDFKWAREIDEAYYLLYFHFLPINYYHQLPILKKPFFNNFYQLWNELLRISKEIFSQYCMYYVTYVTVPNLLLHNSVLPVTKKVEYKNRIIEIMFILQSHYKDSCTSRRNV